MKNTVECGMPQVISTLKALPMFRTLFRSFLTASLIVGGISVCAQADTSTPKGPEGPEGPEGKVILTVSGPVTRTNSGDEMQYDLAMLREIGVESFATSTIWTDGVRAFTGVPLHAVLADVGVTSGVIRATAVNDYSVDIPVSEALDGAALIAFEMDGKPMSLRDKGPLWIVYPYDLSPIYRSEINYTRSIWQLERLSILE